MCAEGEPYERGCLSKCVCVKCKRLSRGEAVRSWKDKCPAQSASSGGAPDLFE